MTNKRSERGYPLRFFVDYPSDQPPEDSVPDEALNRA